MSGQTAELMEAWEIILDDEILFDGRAWYVTAIAQLAMRAPNAKSCQFTVKRHDSGYRRFRVRRHDLIARTIKAPPVRSR